ncbi:Mis12 protein-domain-containing protein [Chytriomyces sp. MP71]|nr:Mis12 protein-domain-containing protein [Chytriomyces sp. MP71]
MSSQGLTRRRTLLLGSLRSAGQQHRRATMVDVCPVLEPGMEAVPTNADSHSHALSLLSSANASVDGGVSAPKDDAEVLQLEDSRNESKPAQDNPNQPFLQRHLFTEKQRARAAAIVAEVFRFDPTDLVDDFYNAVQVTVATVLDAFEAFVLESVAEVAFDSTAAEDAAEMGLMQACTLMEHAVDKTFDKLEVYVLDNIFKVPSNVCITMSQYEVWPRPILTFK